MQDSLTQVQAVAAQISHAALTLTGTSSADAVRGVAEQARLALQQVASLMNGKYAGDYVFSGADTANPPVPNPDSITSSGFYTQIGTQVAALATVPTSAAVGAVIANTVSIASSTAAGTTPFSAYLTGPGLTAARVTVEVAASQKVVLDLPANQNVGGASDPAIAGTGNAVSDIMRALAVVANATGPMAANPDLGTLMGDAARTLSSAGGTVTEEASAIGISQQAMTVAAAGHASMKALVGKQLSGLTDVDMAATISHLQAVSEQLQASYKVLSLAKSLSLSNFL
jgi:flagellin-like hook-associated protein FlgL